MSVYWGKGPIISYYLLIYGHSSIYYTLTTSRSSAAFTGGILTTPLFVFVHLLIYFVLA